MVQIKKIDHDDLEALRYAELVQSIWKNDFIEDFHGEYFSDKKDGNKFDIIVAEEEGLIIGGLIISNDIFVNKYSSPKKVIHKKYLQKQGYKSLVYLIIQPKYRKQKIGSELLEYVLKNYNKIWLSYEPGTIPFYTKGGFKHYMEPSAKEITGIMINK